MAQFRPFAITQTPLSLPVGTTGVGNIVIGVADQDYNNLEGLDFFAGPDEELGYIIAIRNMANNQPTHIAVDNLYLDPLNKAADITLSNSNKTAAQVFSYTQSVLGLNLINGSDKIMFSAQYTISNSGPGTSYIGVGRHEMNISGPFNGFPGTDDKSIGFSSDGKYYFNGNAVELDTPTWTVGDIIDIAFEAGQRIWIRVNGGYWNNNASADPTAGTGGLAAFLMSDCYPVLCPAMYGIMTIQENSMYNVPDSFNFFGNKNASIKFLRSPITGVPVVDDAAFVALAQSLVEVIPATAANAKIQLNNNEYWTSYGESYWTYGYQASL